jgi:hypothetical protein
MWDMMQSMSKDFPAQEERINRKSELLEKHGVVVDISHISKPESPSMEERSRNNQSMWEMAQSMEKKFQIEKKYLDDLEAVYDKAILDILGPEYLRKMK